MKKISKLLVVLCLIFSLMFSLTGCGEINKAETAVNNMFVAFKALDFEEARKYIDLDKITNVGSDEDITQDTEMFMKNLFDKLDYEIIASEKKDGNTVNIMTSITAVDMKPVFGEFFVSALQYAFSTAFSDPKPTEEETEKKMEELFIASVSKSDLARVTNVVVIKVVKTDDGWKIDADDALVNALLGNIEEAIEELEKSFNQ